MSGSMRFGSVCSGIEAASVAWHPLGWKAAWLSEIEKFPCALLAHHYPDVPNLGDMTTLPNRIRSGEVEAPDVFCGGTPCQAFSVAGLRKSLDDARGNLSLTFCEIADAIDQVRLIQQSHPSIVFWENVPGVLNTKDNAFGCFLGALAGEDDALVPPGGRWTNAGFIDGPQRAVAWRVLDAQYFGVAQRRRRVFVIASARDDFDPAAVLFEFEGLRRNTAPRRETGQGFARTAGTLTANGGGLNRPAGNANELDFCIPFTTSSIANYREGVGTLRASGGDLGGGSENLIAARMVAFGEYVDDGTASAMKARDYKDATDLIAQPIPIDMRNAGRDPEKHDEMNRQGVGVGDEGDPAHTVTSAFVHAVAQPIGTDLYNGAITGDVVAPLTNRADGTGTGPSVMQPMAFDLAQITSVTNRSKVDPSLPVSTISKGSDMHVASTMAVRRLTPVECERLQGFPDNYTKIADKTPDGPRYKALGNSWAVPVVRWIGERIARAT